LLRPLRASSTVLILVIAASLGVSGCNSWFKPKAAPKITYQERPVDLLYNIASSYLDQGAWQPAILYYREVERQHPYSEWARRAIMMGAYANYRAHNYSEAVSEADRFVQLYPGNPSAAYAHYLKAVCYFEQIVDVGRDQGSTEQAQVALREVIRRYPDSDYARDAQLKLDMVDDQLAGTEMTVGRFYLRNGDTVAAIGRFKTVLDRYSTTSHAPEALYRMVEAYLTLGVTMEAQRNAAVLGANFPGSPWYAEAYALMTDKGQTMAVTPTGGPRRLRNLFGLGRSSAPAPAPAAKTPSPAIAPPAS
jgi:outer membrane protein assembly factor BamD